MQLSNEQMALAANTMRCLSIDAVQAASSGHPGMPMGMADVAAVLWLKHLNYRVDAPNWAGRDRFVLSGGHGSALLYSVLHLAGYEGVTLDELRRFRQMGSLTPGHPEYGLTAGVEATTGPLGQGIGMAVGMALAAKMAQARGKLENADQKIYVFCGDGDMMEGISHEACSTAGHLKLGNLIMFYDSNRITIEGKTDLACSDDATARFQAYGWNVLDVDGHDYAAIDAAISAAKAASDKPTMIICRTTIGKGSPNKAGSASCHGSPLGPDEVKLTKQALGFDPEKSFFVPEEVREIFAARAKELAAGKAIVKPACNCSACDIAIKIDWPESIATRNASGDCINALAAQCEKLVGGSADLAPSNITMIKGGGEISADDFSGRNIHFGIREIGMSAIMNGIALYGGFKVFGGTFFVFSDYCRPVLRLSALMKLPVVFVFTHDSFHVGEDGATHEPIEQLAALRAMPGVVTIRPSDATETAAAWEFAAKNVDSPTVLVLSRQKIKTIDRAKYPAASNLEKGAYVLKEGSGALTIIATGSEVELALGAAEAIGGDRVRVVSMPSWELFERQSESYKREVLGEGKRLVVEAGTRFGWERYGNEFLTLDHFGASAPSKALAEKYGFTVENVTEVARKML